MTVYGWGLDESWREDPLLKKLDLAEVTFRYLRGVDYPVSIRDWPDVRRFISLRDTAVDDGNDDLSSGIHGGDSGGPVVDRESGELLGVLMGSTEPGTCLGMLSYAVDLRLHQPFVEQLWQEGFPEREVLCADTAAQ